MSDFASENPRKWGRAPYRVALVHGGPGGGGEMAPLARDLSARGHGVLEPFQTAFSVYAQVDELRDLLDEHAPLILVGFSWGAWLSLLAAARLPDLTSKLILVGCPPFRDEDVSRIRENRLRMLDASERDELAALQNRLANGSASRECLARIAALTEQADHFDPLTPTHDDPVEVRQDIYESVWPEAAEFRSSGRLLEEAARLRCVVVAMHGEHDPHPADGVHDPLSAAVKNFRFELLSRCGHKPWVERHAHDAFLKRLEAELAI